MEFKNEIFPKKKIEKFKSEKWKYSKKKKGNWGMEEEKKTYKTAGASPQSKKKLHTQITSFVLVLGYPYFNQISEKFDLRQKLISYQF